MKSLIQMDDMKVKSKWMPGGEGSQVLVCAIQFRPPAVVELLSNPVSAAHALGKQLQTSIMKISTHQLHVSISRQITLMPLGSTVLGFCPKRKALFQYCVLIDPLWALDDSNFSAHTSISVSHLPPTDQSCSWYILATVIVFQTSPGVSSVNFVYGVPHWRQAFSFESQVYWCFRFGLWSRQSLFIKFFPTRVSQRPSSEEPLLFTLYFSNQLGLNSSVWIQNKLIIFFKTILLEFYWMYRPTWVIVQSLSCVRLFVTPWTAARQASLSFTISWSLLKPMSIQSMMPSNHLILYCPLLLRPSVFPSITNLGSTDIFKVLAHCKYKQYISLHWFNSSSVSYNRFYKCPFYGSFIVFVKLVPE